MFKAGDKVRRKASEPWPHGYGVHTIHAVFESGGDLILVGAPGVWDADCFEKVADDTSSVKEKWALRHVSTKVYDSIDEAAAAAKASGNVSQYFIVKVTEEYIIKLNISVDVTKKED